MRSILCVAVLAATPVLAEVTAGYPVLPDTLVVAGEGSVELAPDRADVRLGVRHEAATPAEALDATARGMKAVIAALSDPAGGALDADVMETSRLSVARSDPEDLRLGQVVIVGADVASDPATPPRFVASQSLDLHLDGIDGIGQLSALGVAAGATEVETVTFRLDDDAAAREEARRRAIAAARRHADSYASAEGRSAGPLVHLVEEDVSEFGLGGFAPVVVDPGPGAPPPSDPEVTAGLAAAPILPGRIIVRAGVTATFALGD